MQDTNRATLYSDLDFERAPWDSLTTEAKQLVQALLQRDPQHRPTAAEALHHRSAHVPGLPGPQKFAANNVKIVFVDMAYNKCLPRDCSSASARVLKQITRVPASAADLRR